MTNPKRKPGRPPATPTPAAAAIPAKLGHSGETIHPDKPERTEILLRTVAYVLGQIPRWGGHFPGLTVAQHSLHVRGILTARGAGPATLLLATIHDAAEVYTGDINPLMKAALRAQGFTLLDDWERRVESVLLGGVIPTEADRAAVKAADQEALSQEMNYFALGNDAHPELLRALNAGPWIDTYLTDLTKAGAQ